LRKINFKKIVDQYDLRPTVEEGAVNLLLIKAQGLVFRIVEIKILVVYTFEIHV
jgi:hypothetical protein